jgi:hypothetical protein
MDERPEPEDERRWRKLYALVLIVLALEIALFYAITRAYA